MDVDVEKQLEATLGRSASSAATTPLVVKTKNVTTTRHGLSPSPSTSGLNTSREPRSRGFSDADGGARELTESASAYRPHSNSLPTGLFNKGGHVVRAQAKETALGSKRQPKRGLGGGAGRKLKRSILGLFSSAAAGGP